MTLALTPTVAPHADRRGLPGTIYGRTRVSADALSGLATGKEDGWDVSWGAGIGYDFTPSLGAVLEWSRNEYRLEGAGKDDVDSTNLGLVLRF